MSDSEEEELNVFQRNAPKRKAVISDDSFIAEPVSDSDSAPPAPFPKVLEPVWVWQRRHAKLWVSVFLCSILNFSAGRKCQQANQLLNQQRASRAVSPGHVTTSTNHSRECDRWWFSPSDNFQLFRMIMWKLPRLQLNRNRNRKRLQPKNHQPPKNHQQQQRRMLQVRKSWALRAACCLQLAF